MKCKKCNEVKKRLNEMIKSEKRNVRDCKEHLQSMAIGALEAYQAVKEWFKEAQ